MYINKNEVEQDIRTLIDMLRKAENLNEYKYIKCNIGLLLDLYKNLYHKEFDCVVPRSTLLEMIIAREDKSVNQIYYEEYLENPQLHDSIAKRVLSIISKYNLPKQIHQEPIKLEDFLDIIHSFFSSYGGGLGNHFNKLVNNNHIDFLTCKSDVGSATNNIFMLNKSYVILNTRNDVEGLLTFAHEVAHAYAQSLIEDKEAAYDDCYSYFEFYSSFLERMMIKYLNDNGIMSEDTKKSNQKFFKELQLYASDLSMFRSLNEKGQLEPNSMLSSSMIYLYGEYLALLKELDYSEDKEGTLERIDNFLKSQGLISKEDSLDILGIDYEELKSGKKLERILKKNNM